VKSNNSAHFVVNLYLGEIKQASAVDFWVETKYEVGVSTAINGVNVFASSA